MPNSASSKAPNKWEGTHTYPRGGAPRRRTVAQFQEDAAARIKADREKRRLGVEKLRRNSIAGLPISTDSEGKARKLVKETTTIDISGATDNSAEDTAPEEVFFDAADEEMPGSNKKKRQASGPTNSQTPMDQSGASQPGVDPAMLALLMSIKKDINDTTKSAVEKIDRRIDENAKAIQKVGEQTTEEMRKLRQHCQENQAKFEERIERQLEVREQKMERRLMTLEAKSSAATGTRSPLRTGRQDAAYLEARRTLKLWPITGEDLEDSVRCFLQSRLKIGEDRVRSLGKISVKPGLGKAARERSEVLATFDNREDRDFVKSMGINLAGQGTVGMSLHVPGHLLDNLYALNSIGYNIKKNQEGIKRSIKFDDSIQDIYLDIYIGGRWQRILPAQARSALKAAPAAASLSTGAGISSDNIISLVQGEAVPGITAVVVPAEEDGNTDASNEQEREA